MMERKKHPFVSEKLKMEELFGTKQPVIGMLHLDYLEGEEFGGLKFVVENAKRDLESMQNGGIDGVLIENWKEKSLGEFVSDETAKNLLLVTQDLAQEMSVPFGLNVLNNDYRVGFYIAKQTGASFVDLDVFVDRVQSDFSSNKEAIINPFTIEPNPQQIWEYVSQIGAEEIPLYVFVQPKHYLMLEKDKTIEQSTQQAIEAGASAVLVTKATGFAPTRDIINRVKSVAGKVPVGIGSGFSSENAKSFLEVVDFAVVGTSLKEDNNTDKPVDINKVKKLMKIVKTSKS